MCVDFTDLNKATPKDLHPLLNIDKLVDNTCGHATLSFLDAFSSYNQIKMNPKDVDKTVFITEQGIYCYNVMPFGLKNAGATYQRMMDRFFKDNVGKNIEVYVDDMVVKTKDCGDHLNDLQEIFQILRYYKLRLNPAKCAFGVAEGKFLGFMISQRGIEANLDQCQAILDMTSPRTLKEVQRLNGRIAALHRFLARSGDRCLPFFKTLKGGKNFIWTAECEKAFQELKAYLSRPPILTTPSPRKPIYVYLAATNVAVSSVLIIEDKDEQRPIYFSSKVLTGAETRYHSLEKLVYALLVSTRKLRPYYQQYEIVVHTDRPMRQIIT